MSSSYLTPGTGADGTQLWVVTVNDDGTSSASELVAIYPGAGPFPASSAFSITYSPNTQNPFFTPFEGGYLFVASGIANEEYGESAYGSIDPNGVKTGFELWFTDGTADGTHLVYDANTSGDQADGIGPPASPQTTVLDNGIALFVATIDGSATVALFSTGPAAGSAGQIAIPYASAPSSLLEVNGKGLFTATLSVGSTDPYSAVFITDGTVEGTERISTETNVSSFSSFVTAAGIEKVSFTGSDQQLWVTDGTTTTRVTTGASVDGARIGLNGRQLFFSAPTTGRQLWSTDGTLGGTTLLSSTLGTGQREVFNTGVFGTTTSRAFFETHGSTGIASSPTLWVTDGTSAGTVQIATWSNDTGQPVAVGNRLFFTTSDATGNVGLSVTNGTVAGTTQLVSQRIGGLSLGPSGTAVFRETDTSGNSTLFITDGTSGGTRAITSNSLTNVGNYAIAGNHLFFTADEGTYPALSYGEIFSVGTSGNAVRLDIGGDIRATNLTVVGSRLLFNAQKPSGESESWITDGTQAGTHVVQGSGFVTPGNGTAAFNAPLPCFLAGTRLRTPNGEIAVETLREGDLVLTASGRTAPIVWIGQREVDLARHPDPARVAPVRIRRGAFADNVPSRDLLLSPDHAIAIDGVLIPVQHLIDGHAIAQERPASAHYFHIELPVHDVVLAEGLAVESYLDTGNRANFSDAEGPTTLHPDFWALHWDGACAKLVVAGPIVEAARARLRARAGEGMLAAA